MFSNYELQQYFLDIIKEFSISNPDKQIDSNFIYSQLIEFNVKNTQGPYKNVENYFSDWFERYRDNKNISVFQDPRKLAFLGFANGKIKGKK